MLASEGFCTVVFIFVSSFFLKGQEQFGMASSNYSPTASMLHNPSSIVDSEVMLDIHAVGFDAFLHSNYAYLDKDEFSYWKNAVLTQDIPDAKFNFSRDKYSLYSAVDMQYLSATYQYKNHGFGMSSRVRTFIDVRNVPEIFANAIQIPQIKGQGQINTNILGRDLNASNVNIGLLSYAEYGLAYANAVIHRDRDLLIVGGAIKFLWGLAGGGMHIDNLDYKIDSTGVFSYSNLTAQTSISEQILGGSGYSGDIGFTYKKMLDNVTNYNPFRREAGCRIYDYKVKVGMSIIDVGYVKFNKSTNNSYVKGASGVLDDFTNLSISSEPGKFFSETLNVPDSLITEDTSSFTVVVPAAFVFQYDYNFEKHNMFMSVEYIHGLTPSGTFGIQRPSVIVFTPRYETRNFEVALSFGMYNLQEVRSGLMLRLGPLTLGTDKLGSFMGLSDVAGFDFYGHIAFKIIHQKRCGKIRFW
ncbi:MAG: hypothetical protein ACJA0Q_000557 [Saprospiraceae bacterium]|jgi:hypothetical protein